MKYLNISFKVSGADNVAGGMYAITNLYKFRKPNYLLGYNLTANYPGTSSVTYESVSNVVGEMIIEAPPQSTIELSLSSKSPAQLQIDQANFQKKESRMQLNPGQFQISPLLISEFNFVVSAFDAASIGSTLRIYLSLWFEEDIEQLN